MPDIRESGTLDDFNRPDETPLQPPWYWQPGSDFAVILESGAAQSPAVPPASALDYYDGRPEGIKAPAEIWGVAEGSAALGSAWRIGLYTLLSVKTAFPDGYQVLLGTGVGGAFLVLRRYDNGGFTTLVNVAGPTFSGGYMLLYRVDAAAGSATHEVWTTSSPGTDFVLRFQHVEASPHPGPYQFVLGGTDVLVGWSEVGGGTIRHTQIYRYVSN